ncbi:hypothetical protein [Acinetobacter sp. ANC 4648]|uniref:hypothetical protein n=1 Tax=Acinetobacter sp. ANC 4648 TaxID=1977875 RepID=UPI000A33813E|nr:hypothetical protein [Acinetobacter sp. ANC 4648]OTG83619.1 hypothetical protein B9T27_03640 [Acinetobacter sp. ANC 4648]
MNHEDFTHQVTSKLDGLAKNHRNKAVVMSNVLDHIHEKPTNRFSSWKMTGFALAAAITGFVVLPNVMQLNEKPHSQQVIMSPKLSPQMMEDLEMISVFGEDTTIHGS